MELSSPGRLRRWRAGAIATVVACGLGKEPPKTGSGADGKNCLFSAADITYK